jgi:glycosyltransferase involved in cell wall biosynthesis
MNAGFQKNVLKHLDSITLQTGGAEQVTLFSYSYAAKDLFIEAKRRGWRTILCQIDPGVEEANLVEALSLARPEWQCARFAPPRQYFDQWREECELAGKIIVNSEWSKKALIRQGVDDAKIVEIPIPYDPPQATSARSPFNGSFSASRPLRLLFLGQVSLRKGIRELVLAMHRLQGEPVELTVVGDPQVQVPENLKSLNSINWVGGVHRAETSAFFNRADAFILPTHSDGFGLAQLEAVAHGVPVIASSHCARVVTDHVNGRILSEVTEEAIEGVIREILAEPTKLAAWTSRCEVPATLQPESVARALNGLLIGNDAHRAPLQAFHTQV